MPHSAPPTGRLAGSALIRFVVATLILGPAAGAAAATETPVPLPDPVYEIEIDARFEPDDQSLEGSERLRWRNTSGTAIEDLQFHLYLNAFRNDRSTFLLESGGRHRRYTMDDDGWGWIEVRSIRIAETGLDLKPREEYLAPDDGNTDDRTVARYPLPEPLAPGEWIELEIEFTARLPKIFARTGVHGEYVVGGQWFPKIAVFEDAGVRGREHPGWNCHQFHVKSEFYADFGNYDVRLTLPARYQGKIGATGRQVEESVDDDTVTVRFIQDGVHDFAWTADPRYVVIEDRFDPARDVPPDRLREVAAVLGLPLEQLALPTVEITLLVQPAHHVQARRYLDTAKLSIRELGLWLGPYPYETLTLVDPPAGARGSGGMEYPTFITLGTRAHFRFPGFDELRFPENVTVHEYAHQYFQGMVATNEFEDSWLDEGMTAYWEARIMDLGYPDGTYRVLGNGMTSDEAERASVRGSRFEDPMATWSWKYVSWGSYVVNNYMRPAVTMRHLERYLGPETFNRALRHYFETWRFRHPSTHDFERTFQEAVDVDLDWFFRQALHSTRRLDYAVRRAISEKEDPPRGWFGDGDDLRLLPEEDDGDGDDGAEGEDDDDGDDDEEGEDEDEDEGDGEPEVDGETWHTEVVLLRNGEFRHPVTVELVFEGGERERRDWDGEDRWVRWEIVGARKLESVEIDPDHVMLLDIDPLNNSRRLDPNAAPRFKILIHLLFWLQNAIEAASLPV